jgi:hypothetical protein
MVLLHSWIDVGKRSTQIEIEDWIHVVEKVRKLKPRQSQSKAIRTKLFV